MKTFSTLYWILLEPDLESPDLYFPSDTPVDKVNPRRLYNNLKNKHKRWRNRLIKYQVHELDEYQKQFSVDYGQDLCVTRSVSCTEVVMGSEFLNDNHQEIAALLSSISDTPMEIKESGMQPKNSDSREKELMEIIQKKYETGLEKINKDQALQWDELRELERNDMRAVPREHHDPPPIRRKEDGRYRLQSSSMSPSRSDRNSPSSVSSNRSDRFSPSVMSPSSSSGSRQERYTSSPAKRIKTHDRREEDQYRSKSKSKYSETDHKERDPKRRKEPSDDRRLESVKVSNDKKLTDKAKGLDPPIKKSFEPIVRPSTSERDAIIKATNQYTNEIRISPVIQFPDTKPQPFQSQLHDLQACTGRFRITKPPPSTNNSLPKVNTLPRMMNKSNQMKPPTIGSKPPIVGIANSSKPPNVGAANGNKPPAIGASSRSNTQRPISARPTTTKHEQNSGNKRRGSSPIFKHLRPNQQSVHCLLDDGTMLIQNKPQRVIIRGPNGTSTNYGDPKDYDDAINSSVVRPDNPVTKRYTQGQEYLFYKTVSGGVVSIGPVAKIQPLIQKFFLSS